MKKLKKKLKKQSIDYDEISKLMTHGEREKVINRINEIAAKFEKDGSSETAEMLTAFAKSEFQLKGHSTKSEVIYLPVTTKVRGDIYNEFQNYCLNHKIDKQLGLTEALKEWLSKKRIENLLTKDSLICFLTPLPNISDVIASFLGSFGVEIQEQPIENFPDEFQGNIVIKVFRGNLKQGAWTLVVKVMQILSFKVQ